MAELIRVALAAAPFPRSLAHALESVENLANAAAAQDARVICFPESYIPGYRGIGESVRVLSASELKAALETVREIAQRLRIGLILPMDWDADGKLLNVAMVISAEGKILGYQAKNQLDPSEDQNYIPGTGRQVFQFADLRFGVCICHEGFRYPETVRWAARQGATVVFHPHCTGNNHAGPRLSQFRHPENPYYEQAMLCRALENTIYFAGVNYAFQFQESATCVFGPQGERVAAQPYGQAGVLVVDINLTLSTGLLANRFDPLRHGKALTSSLIKN